MTGLPTELLDEAARRFRLLGDPTRLRLLNALHAGGELSVGEIADHAETSLANASQHLQQLEREGLLRRRRDGTTVRYRIADPSLLELCDIVCTGLRRRREELVGTKATAGRRRVS